MYASSACEKVLHVDPDELTGKPFLLYLRSDDLAPFVDQMDLVKGTTAIIHMRFWFQPPLYRKEVPCEAIFIGTADGIVTVIRRCKPFIRKHLIGSREQFDSAWASTMSFRWNQAYDSSPASSISTQPTPPKFDECGFSTWNSPHSISRSSIDRIKIMDMYDDDGARPFADIPKVDPSLAQDDTIASMAPVFKAMIIRDLDYIDDEDNEHEEVVKQR